MEFSVEQKTYINFLEKCDTKLLATAGSGKTFCIIHHIKSLIHHNVYDPQHIHMLTFSKNAKDDFRRKMSEYNVNQVPQSNINTIDSFAWSLLGGDVCNIDVSILSYTLLKFLEEFEHNISGIEQQFTNVSLSHVSSVLATVKCIFVDEAQDLNEIQYKILCSLKRLCGASLHLIGDPNQSIYQFRHSSDRYLIDFPAPTFFLTKNFRSKGHIVEFCSYLRPYDQLSLTFEESNTSKLDVTFYTYNRTHSFEHYLLSILHYFQAKQIPLHKVAILAPTRGYLKTSKGACRYKGLCYIANVLFKHDIPFQQFYNDMGSNMSSSGNGVNNNDCGKVNYNVKHQHVNLMTYTASKGLEWDYVIIVDANAYLISQREYSIDKYNAERYLLYVACSRPRKNLIIFTKHRFTNPWFTKVPCDKYKIAKVCQDNLMFFDTSKLFIKNESNDEEILQPNTVSNYVNSLTEPDLFEIYEKIKSSISSTEYCMTDDVPANSHGVSLLQTMNEKNKKCLTIKIPDKRQGFASRFLEHFFYIHTFQKSMEDTYIMCDVRNVIQSENIIPCSNERYIYWYFTNRGTMTWEAFDLQKKTFNKHMIEFFETRFDRDKPFGSYTLVDKFYDAFISTNHDRIKERYNSYLHLPNDLYNIMYVTLVAYAIETTHYFYIVQADQFYADIVKNNTDAYMLLASFAHTYLIHRVSDMKQMVTRDNFISFIDFIWSNKDEHYVCKIKPFGTTNLKDVIHMILTLYVLSGPHNVIRNATRTKSNALDFVTLHLSKGTYTKWRIDICESDIATIIHQYERKKYIPGTSNK